MSHHEGSFAIVINSTKLSLPTQGNEVGPLRFKYSMQTLKGKAIQLWNAALAARDGRLMQDFYFIVQEF